VLVKNDDYWDAPKPYLDSIVVKAVPDASQRLNTVSANQAEVATVGDWSNIAQAEGAGLTIVNPDFNGGQYLAMNQRRAPFDDQRAREAIAAALDIPALSLAVDQGHGELVDTFFQEGSPFYVDLSVAASHDAEKAQELLDELEADGKPLEFTITILGPQQRVLVETIQAQLAQYENLTLHVEQLEPAESVKLYSTHEYDMLPFIADFIDPEPRLYTMLYSTAGMNMAGVSDPEIDEAILIGRQSSDVAERKEAYEIVQQRLNDLTPVIFMTRVVAGFATSPDVKSLPLFGRSSPLTEDIWLAGGGS
jgi:ABC-type dipeptide transport system, periplasmic component